MAKAPAKDRKAKPSAPKAAKPAAKPKPAAKRPDKPAAKAPAKPASKPPAKAAAKPSSKPPAPLKSPAPAKGPVAAPKPAPRITVKSELPAVASAVAATAAAQAAAQAAAAAGVAPGGRPKPKGITIVSQRPQRKPKPKKVLVMPSLGQPLLRPGVKRPKPLIASGPNAPSNDELTAADPASLKGQTPFSKKELERFKGVLVRKRAELVGDVRTMEDEALQGSSGSLSHLPQHMAEQGSDAYDQALSLDLAQVDRNLIREIDEALKRIENGTFGLCELTGKPINRERLEELPWTRYSIEAARERERRSFRA